MLRKTLQFLASLLGFGMLIAGPLVFLKISQFKAMAAAGAATVMPPETVTAAAVTEDTWEVTLAATGSLAAVQGVTIGAEMPGKVARIAFEAGTAVQAGDMLVQLDTSTEEAQLRAAEATAALAQPLIRATPSLDWLLLTKRIERVRGLLPSDWGDGWPNVWMMTSVEDQETADRRIPELLRVPARVRGVSYEPALGPVDFERIVTAPAVGKRPPISLKALTGWYGGAVPNDPTRLDWIIVGGESGPGARPFDVSWARSTVKACADAGVACFVKQLGALPMEAFYTDESNALIDEYDDFTLVDRQGLEYTPDDGQPPRGNTFVRVALRDGKGGDWDEWPHALRDLRVRQFPASAGVLA